MLWQRKELAEPEYTQSVVGTSAAQAGITCRLVRAQLVYKCPAMQGASWRVWDSCVLSAYLQVLSAHTLLLLVFAASLINDGVAAEHLQESVRCPQQKLSTAGQQCWSNTMHNIQLLSSA